MRRTKRKPFPQHLWAVSESATLNLCGIPETKPKEGKMPENFTKQQLDLADRISLSLDQLDGIFGLIAIAELDEVYLDHRVQSVLFTADELLRQTKTNFNQLILGEN